MQDVERSAGDELAVGNTAGEDLGAVAKRRSPRRWTAEEKARIVRESFWPGKQVGESERIIQCQHIVDRKVGWGQRLRINGDRAGIRGREALR